jgi:hypothetical protein
MSARPTKLHQPEACQFVPCSPSTLALAARNGKLTRAYDSARRVVYDVTELERFKAEREARKAQRSAA